MQMACLTDVGLQREHNEDNVLACHFDLGQGNKMARYHLLLVSDGMGGAAAGEVASTLTIRTVTETIFNELLSAHVSATQTHVNLENILMQAVESANHEVFVASHETPHCMGMGATLTAAIICQGRLYVAQVGDSRCYLFRDNALQQVTQDHSLVAELLRDGRITEEQARNHPRKNIITRAIGSRINVKIDTYRVDLKVGDSVMLCSDGLSGMVSDENLRTSTALGLKRRSGLEALCREMIRMANEAGGQDNISVALFLAEGDDIPSRRYDEVCLVEDSTLSWDLAVQLSIKDGSFEEICLEEA